MEIYSRHILDQKVLSMKEDPVQRQLLRITLKYEMQLLLQRLAEVGEESVVVMASLADGCQSVLASDQGEKFLQNEVVSLFKDHFVRYLHTGNIDAEMSAQIEMIEEPETFMHMKKHQIEQYNRRRDKEDKSIDETVSQLVQNILKEGKEKERVNKGHPGFYALPGRRKRNSGCWYQDERNNSFSTDGCSRRKRKSISSFFPALSQGFDHVSTAYSVPITSPYAAVAGESSPNDMSVPEENIVTIKIEPIDDSEYGGEVTDSGSRVNDSDFVKSKLSSQGCVNGSQSVNDSVQGGTEQSESLDGSSSVDQSNKRQKMLGTDGDVELPFVEEFYQRKKPWEPDVKLLDQEISSPSPKRFTCYKQSRKKSNTFNLVLDGYSYIKDKQGKGGTLYWKCGRNGCKGRVIQRGEELIISQVHVHEPGETDMFIRTQELLIVTDNSKQNAPGIDTASQNAEVQLASKCNDSLPEAQT